MDFKQFFLFPLALILCRGGSGWDGEINILCALWVESTFPECFDSFRHCGYFPNILVWEECTRKSRDRALLGTGATPRMFQKSNRERDSFSSLLGLGEVLLLGCYDSRIAPGNSLLFLLEKHNQHKSNPRRLLLSWTWEGGGWHYVAQ